MHLIYTTDLHGNVQHYTYALDMARRLGCRNLHLGADLLPKNGSSFEETVEAQCVFIEKFVSKFYKRAKEEGINVFAFFGNDDYVCWRDLWEQVSGAPLLCNAWCRAPVPGSQMEMITYRYVPDYPFGLKTLCKLEKDHIPEPYISTPVEIDWPEKISSATQVKKVPIDDVEGYFHSKGTIDDDLESLTLNPSVCDPNKTIANFHTPPAFVGLDVCIGNRAVGSRAVYKWIEKNQPQLVLCGHIHESPNVTGIWKTTIGKSTVIQPGRLYAPRVVEISVDDPNAPMPVTATLHEQG